MFAVDLLQACGAEEPASKGLTNHTARCRAGSWAPRASGENHSSQHALFAQASQIEACVISQWTGHGIKVVQHLGALIKLKNSGDKYDIIYVSRDIMEHGLKLYTFYCEIQDFKEVGFVVGCFKSLVLLGLEIFYLGCTGGDARESLTLGICFVGVLGWILLSRAWGQASSHLGFAAGALFRE